LSIFVDTINVDNMARAGNNHKGGSKPYVERLAASQIVRQAMAEGLNLSDPEKHLIQSLIDIYNNEAEATNNRIAAIKLLMQYLWGNPKQIISVEDNSLEINIVKGAQ
jgi:metal-responsive CopG/Arc/MetJ family transcriptional regulator